MSPRMPWEAKSAELLNPLNGVEPVPTRRSSRVQPRSAPSVVQQFGGRDQLLEAIRRFNEEACIIQLLEDALAEGVLRRVASTNGGEWAGPCPLCGGEDRLRVWPTPRTGKPGAWCRRCEASGDALSWQVRIGGDDPHRRGATAEFLRRLGLV